jgi:hypothetical protein
MRDKLKRARRRSRYRLRKQIVEPVFGQIKQASGSDSSLVARHQQSEGRMDPHLHSPKRPTRSSR